MKRARLFEAGKPFVLDEVEIPEAPEGGLVIKTAFSGICGSDFHQWINVLDYGYEKTEFSASSDWPVVPGHEICGLVHSVGPNQSSCDLKVGDRAIVYPWGGCGECAYCKRNATSNCRIRSKCFGFGLPGGYASYVVVPESKFVVKLPDSIPLDMACMLPCSAVTAYNAVSKALPVVEHATNYEGKASVLIVGGGGLGLWCLQIAKAVLPSTTKVVVADIAEDKLTMARKHGCDDVIHWSRNGVEKELIKQTQDKAFNGGFDAIIDFVNTTVTAERVFKCLQQFGILVMVGFFGGEARISLPQMVSGSRQIKGIYVGSIEQLKQLLQLVAAKKIVSPPLRQFNLEEITNAMHLLRDRKMNGRGIIKFE